jgi:hypothetical protein
MKRLRSDDMPAVGMALGTLDGMSAQVITVDGQRVLTTSSVIDRLGIKESTWNSYVARGQGPGAEA